ncbi:ABC transporter permease [Maricaulis sp. CAU 1757]
MRAIYLIARREFLSYVGTWGFWISLLSVPVIMTVFGGLPVLIENSQPDRYYVLVDETGGELAAAYEARLEQQRAEMRAEMTEAITEMAGGEGPLSDALVEQVDLPSDRYVRIEAPETELDRLRPYLLGEAQVDTPDGPRDLFAAVYLDRTPDGEIEIEYWSTNLTDGGLKSEIRNAMREQLRLGYFMDNGVDPVLVEEARELDAVVRELNPERGGDAAEVTTGERLPLVIGIAMAFGLWIVIFSVVNMLLTAMIEEKGNKVLEMMLASARHHEILTGKLLGVAAVSATLLVFWGTLAALGGLAAQQLASAAGLPIGEILATVLDPGLIGAALFYFIVGYLMYGAIFLAIGSLCDTIQDAQSLMSPMMMVMMLPMILVVIAIDAPDSPFIAMASWVPLWTPFLMMVRLPQDVGMVEILATNLGMLATAAFVIWGAGRVFRMGALNQANQDTVKGWFSLGGKGRAKG